MKENRRNNIVKRFFVALIAFSICIPTSTVVTAGDRTELKELETDTDLIASYFDVDESGNVKYFRDKAINDGVDREIIELADQVYAYGLSQLDSRQSTYTGRVNATAKKGKAFPVYGNWCGKGYPPKGKNPTPIDLLDAGCKSHDKCYGGHNNKDYHKCSCDRNFLKYIQRNYSRMTGVKQKSMAKLMEAWLKIKTTHYSAKGGNFSCKK